MLMAISSSGAVTITGEMSGSDAANALLLDGTGSLAFTTTASYNAFSASYAIASASLSSRTTQVERTYATTGSNTFTGAQYVSDTSNGIGFTSTASFYTDGGLRVGKNAYVSGTAYFNNIVVFGTSSIQYITSSQVNIGANIITVNTDTPAVRFGGLSVFDSGSTQLTGSMLWDSERNHWVYSNPSGSSYSGGMLISGPRSSALGCEQGTTSCMLLVGQGGDHLTSSMIYHDSSRTCFYGNTVLACSNNIGSDLNSRQTFTGSINISGSMKLVGSVTGPFYINTTGSSANAQLDIVHASCQEGLAIRNISGTSAYSPIAVRDLNGDIFQLNQCGRLYISGSVGIGTSTPVRKLDIVTTSEQLRLAYDSSGTTYTDFRNDSAGGLLINTSAAYIINYIGGSERLRISNNCSIVIRGSLGVCNGGAINLTIPNGLNGGTIRMDCFTGANMGDMYFTGGSGEGFLLSGTGRMGIGTISPSHKVHISTTDDNAYALRVQGRTDNASGVWTGIGLAGEEANTKAAILFQDIGVSYSRGRLLFAVNNAADQTSATPSDTRMMITNDGIVYALTAGVDGTYCPMIGGMYSANNNETNLISTAVSSNGAQSGFRFDVSNGAGSTGRTTSMTINRGSVSVVGSLSKGSGSFRIKHPLASKKCTHQLVHSFIEGPNADLIYSGHTKLIDGVSCINIDCISRMTEGTFEALNRCVRIFTTNETSWSAVRGKVCGNMVVIESQDNTSEDEISWMVIGERQDQHMFDTEWTDSEGRVITEPEIEPQAQ
jgi:hypothetical protein